MRIIFAGTPEFAAFSLKTLMDSSHEIIAVYTQPDRPAGRGRTLHKSPVKELALSKNLSIFQPESLKNIKEHDILRELAPDLMIVAAYGLILPNEVLKIPKYGCLNIHASLLPRWRGAAPIQRAILSGDSVTGICIMQMDAGLDTGDVLLTKFCSIENDETSETLHDKLSILGSEALMESLYKLEQKSLVPIQQSSNGITYAHKISKEEAKINWDESAQEIERKIRAFNPWPVAFTHIQKDNKDDVSGETLRIWNAKILTDTIEASEKVIDELEHAKEKIPGYLLKVSSLGMDVVTGEGILRILEMQLPGGKRLSIRELLNSKANLFEVGKIFY